MPIPAIKLCPDCEIPWTKLNDKHLCEECGTYCPHYRVRLDVNSVKYQISYDAKGRPLRDTPQIKCTIEQVRHEVVSGMYVREKYTKGSSVVKTFPEHVRTLKTWKFLTIEERELLDDFMVPYLADTGIFTICKIHLMDFISTFRLKGERKQMAERIFDKVLEAA